MVVQLQPADAPKTGSSASTEWRFRVTAPGGQEMLLAAETQEEMHEWARHIEDVAARVPRGY